MKWMLVAISIATGNPEVTSNGMYDDMMACFLAREQLIWETFGNPDGYPPPNHQVVCIPTDKY